MIDNILVLLFVCLFVITNESSHMKNIGILIRMNNRFTLTTLVILNLFILFVCMTVIADERSENLNTYENEKIVSSERF